MRDHRPQATMIDGNWLRLWFPQAWIFLIIKCKHVDGVGRGAKGPQQLEIQAGLAWEKLESS